MFASAGRGYVHQATILGDGTAGEGNAVAGQLFDEFIVIVRFAAVFVVDDFLQFGLDGVPTDALALVGFSAATKERT